MKLYLEFDVSADIIDVPQHIIEKRRYYRNKFLDWIYNPKVNHPYRIQVRDASGEKFVGMCYGSEAFVDWLNKKVLIKNSEKAFIIATNLEIDEDGWRAANIPFIFF